jgi:hypothetical protein
MCLPQRSAELRGLLHAGAAPLGKDRYNEVILARRLAPYDCKDVSKEAADAAIIASWNSSTGQIEWKEEARRQPHAGAVEPLRRIE